MRTILLTGFEPFDGDAHNPSAAVALALDGLEVSKRVAVRGVVLRVASHGLRARLRALLRHADAAIGLGLAKGRTRPSLERWGYNERNFRVPDANGEQPRGRPIVRGGPAKLPTSLPLAAIRRAWRRAGIPSSPSDDPGRYACNEWIYVVAHLRPDLVAGFVHLPADEHLALDQECAFVPLATQIHAVRLALEVVARMRRSRRAVRDPG